MDPDLHRGMLAQAPTWFHSAVCIAADKARTTTTATTTATTTTITMASSRSKNRRHDEMGSEAKCPRKEPQTCDHKEHLISQITKQRIVCH